MRVAIAFIAFLYSSPTQLKNPTGIVARWHTQKHLNQMECCAVDDCLDERDEELGRAIGRLLRKEERNRLN
jgi:hypothetical protein